MTTAAPSRVVLDFDHHSDEATHDRPAVIRRVLGHPVFWTEAHGGYWVVTKVDLIRQMYGDPETFSSLKNEAGVGGVTIPEVGPRLIPVETDAPYHTAMRKIMMRKINRRIFEELRPQITAAAAAAVSDAVQQGEFDLVELAGRLPAEVIVSHLGFPEELRASFITAVHHVLSLQASMSPLSEAPPDEETLQRGMAAFQTLQSSIAELLASRRAEPADDVATYLVQQTERELSDEELFMVCFVLFIGATENTTAFLGDMLVYLAEHPDVRATLIEQPDLIPAAVEELLRLSSVATGLARTVTRDTELGGVQLRKGDRIMSYIPAANRDPEVFPDPDSFRLQRENINQHVAFGYGSHSCMGVGLTRLEADILLRAVLDQMPNYTVDRARSQRVDDAHIAHAWKTIAASAGDAGTMGGAQ